MIRDARGRPRLDWAIDSEARSILATASSGSDPTVLAWAAGVVEACHALYLADIPIPPDAIRPSHHGVGLPGEHLWYLGEAGGWSVYRSVRNEARPIAKHRGVTYYEYDRQPIAAGSWAAVRALVDDRVTPRLRAEIEDVLAQRREHTPRYDPAETRRDWTDADWAAEFARQDVRADIERRCYDLAARVWDRLRPARPVVPDEQLSLFDLAGVL